MFNTFRYSDIRCDKHLTYTPIEFFLVMIVTKIYIAGAKSFQ